MDRKAFLKSAATFGICSCAGMSVLTGTEVAKSEENPEMKKLTGMLDFIHKRFAKLINILKSSLGERQRGEILEQLGKGCGSEHTEYFAKYQSNLDGFLQDLQKQWIERIDRNKEDKLITLYGKKTGKCFCPFVKLSLTPADFCDCSRGWMKQTFTTVTGKPPEVIVKESVLRGSNRCVFQVDFS